MTDQRKRWGDLVRSNTVAPTPTKLVRKKGRFASLRHAFTKSAHQNVPTRSQTRNSLGWADQELVPAPLRLRTDRNASFSSIQSTEVLHYKPRVRFNEYLQVENETLTPTQYYQAKALPALPPPRRLQPQQQQTPMRPQTPAFTASDSQYQSLPKEDWEEAVEESYDLGEFANDAEAGEAWLEGELVQAEEEEKEEEQTEPIWDGSILNRPRPIPRLTRTPEEYGYVDRTQTKRRLTGKW